MKSTVLVFWGMPVSIRYHIHIHGQPEWHLDKDAEEMTDQHLMLLEHLLRKHHNSWIIKMLWEEHQAETYEADARASATAEDINF